MIFKPEVVVFDVIETLFSLEPMRERLVSLGLPPHALELWFSRTLRDAFALSAMGSYAPFEAVSQDALRELLAEQGRQSDEKELKSALSGMQELPPHPDVAASLQLLQGAGVRVFALSNGSKAQTQKLFARANLSDGVEEFLSTDEVKKFKPSREVYDHALEVAGVEASQMMLVAAHGWDIAGAKNAGLSAGWVMRREKRLSSVMLSPDVGGQSLIEVCEAMLRLPRATD